MNNDFRLPWQEESAWYPAFSCESAKRERERMRLSQNLLEIILTMARFVVMETVTSLQTDFRFATSLREIFAHASSGTAHQC